MINKIIKVILKREYGRNRYYPARSEELETILLRNMKRKSFTYANLIELKSAGFEVEIESKKPILE